MLNLKKKIEGYKIMRRCFELSIMINIWFCVFVVLKNYYECNYLIGIIDKIVFENMIEK